MGLGMTQPGESVCEACERERKPDERGWYVGREGEDLCPECAEDLRGALKEQIAKLPERIGLCPECAPEFYYPLAPEERLTCPTPGCGLDMIVYAKAPVPAEVLHVA